MGKFVAPETTDHFVFDNVDYRRDEEGLFEIRHPEHIRYAKMHGAVEVVDGIVPDAPAPVVPARVPGADEEIAARDAVIADKDAEIEALKAQLAAAHAAPPAPVATETQTAPEGTAAPADGVDASGDTSSGTGDTTEAVDLDTLSRDELVDHLKTKGVSVPANISKAGALKIAKEA